MTETLKLGLLMKIDTYNSTKVSSTMVNNYTKLQSNN